MERRRKGGKERKREREPEKEQKISSDEVDLPEEGILSSNQLTLSEGPFRKSGNLAGDFSRLADSDFITAIFL